MLAAITGATGFIGQHLVRRFAECGWTVRPITRGDFESGAMERLVAGADVVVHAAGATRAPTRLRLRASNVGLTARVLDAARRGGAARLIFISSQAAAGPAAFRDTPVTEDTPPAPVEAYGQSKLDAETLIRSQTDVPAVILRPAAVYGPGDRDFLAMFRLARRRAAIHPGNREHWLSVVHASDVASTVVQSATSAAAPGNVYFLGNEEPVQWSALFRLAADVAGRTLLVDVDVPRPLVTACATVGDLAARVTGHASLLTSGKLALSRPLYWICASDRARRDGLFAPRIDLRDGMQETYHWYRARGWL